MFACGDGAVTASAAAIGGGAVGGRDGHESLAAGLHAQRWRRYRLLGLLRLSLRRRLLVLVLVVVERLLFVRWLLLLWWWPIALRRLLLMMTHHRLLDELR